MRTTGRIVSVQEQRFRLRTDAGQVILLTLAHDAPLDIQALDEFRRTGAALVVEYSGEANLVGGVAHIVHRARA